MKVHYINILLFALPLNILVYNQRNYYITSRHTQTTRLLCECELYAPSNYDNDPEMKAVMQGFDRQTSQRFEEYNERLLENKQKCKEQCNKEIQKIILKDKLEKELMDKFATLHTDIKSDAIPTCVCEKSLADQVEKGCLRCGYGLGTVAPTVGLIGAVAVHQWTNAALVAAAKKGIEVGMAKAIEGVKGIWELGKVPGVNFGEVVTATNFSDQNLLGQALQTLANDICGAGGAGSDKTFCTFKLKYNQETIFIKYVTKLTTKVAEDAGAAATEAKDVALANATNATHSFNIAIIASVVAIVVIVLIMVIIYLILRYRRKKKMKKKLQYIKLLKE
ncbi:rifin [Plasmodium falciparum IGH-CR14]|uniref:Rifin n=1 Tax=Plasmodium falciparum IGH-CR14 TaxID=580059 RepID=A0A0L1I9D0_PLAFA|nr:rifin [Plasmodium falciparum IGH-CR14]